MNDSAIKQAIFNRLIITSLSENDRLLIGCLVYRELVQQIKIDSDIRTNINNAIDTIKSYYINTLDSYKVQYISYNKLTKYIDGLKNKNIISTPNNVIMEINRLYFEKSVATPFSTTSFSQKMYMFTNLTQKEQKYLSHVHYDIVVPIVTYYIVNFGMDIQLFHIYRADLVKGYPGKVIDIFITNVSPTRIISDLTTGNIGVDKSYIGQLTCIEDRLQILTR